MVDEPDSLAFFRPTHYYVDAVGAVSDSDSDPGAGWEKVTKEELFKRLAGIQDALRNDS